MTWSPVLRHREDKGRGQETHPGVSSLFLHTGSQDTLVRSPQDRNLNQSFFSIKEVEDKSNYHRDNP